MDIAIPQVKTTVNKILNGREFSKQTNDVLSVFEKLNLDDSWAFEGLTQGDTNYITHGYHRYPAKFIPQLASRLINDFSKKDDLVVDPFMGSATTLVEAKVLGRRSVGVDINPVAYLIAKAKVTPIDPDKLDDVFKKIVSNLSDDTVLPFFKKDNQLEIPEHERIDYWFKPKEKKKLGIIYTQIKKIKDKDIQGFFLCGFSHILKNCSIWLMKSNKPTRDLNKKIPDPFQTFIRHIKKMINKNKAFWDLLEKNRFLDIESNPVCGDARTVPVPNNSVALMVTSPPYVTSYEYADLHQLSALWFNYTDDLAKFRKSFMGSAHNDVKETVIGSELGERIVEALQEHNTKKDKEVAIYFSEMHDSFIEMKRYLKKGGIASIVIGDTAFKGVPVLNAEVFVEQMQNLGFKIYKIIKRRIPSKILPSMRDKKTGRFTSLGNHNKTLAYSFEYIITMQKI
jgi:DNA modification methylase